ncbi:MAG: SpaH/EbpB family LPXTG-anchored major pilin [Butyricicoccus sp.]|jgi:fimbrial isopeptide formation D2 family protein/LPXTG-motif cell wall-anchored protein
MKTLKRLSSILLAVFMVMAMAIPAFAQEVTVDGDGTASITISNAAKGETYTIYKLFDATVTGTKGGSIAYTGTIPDALSDYFTADDKGNISETAAARNESKEMSDGLKSALTDWAENESATKSAVSDGSELTFKNLPYGYYVVTTTQGTSAITVDSTNPNAKIVDKNGTVPSGLTKTVNDDDVNFGDTVTYTVTFNTSNYDGNGTAAKKIMSYTIEDTLPNFLTNVNVTSIIVDNDGNDTTTDDRATVTAQFSNKKIVLDWYDETNSKFLYDNGATVTLTYTAVVTDQAAIAGNGNTNKVTVTWQDENDETPHKLDEKTASIYTYAIALKKVNDKGEALSGAKFQLPFYVKTTPDANGAYIYAGTTAGTGLTNQLTTPDTGEITIKGVASGTYSITEVEAPNGYNKLTEDVTVTAKKTSDTTTNTIFYIKDGTQLSNNEEGATEVTYTNDKLAATAILVINKSGAELPSTGGMGTTIFYIAGTVLVLGAGVILVTRRRMSR